MPDLFVSFAPGNSGLILDYGCLIIPTQHTLSLSFMSDTVDTFVIELHPHPHDLIVTPLELIYSEARVPVSLSFTWSPICPILLQATISIISQSTGQICVLQLIGSAENGTCTSVEGSIWLSIINESMMRYSIPHEISMAPVLDGAFINRRLEQISKMIYKQPIRASNMHALRRLLRVSLRSDICLFNDALTRASVNGALRAFNIYWLRMAVYVIAQVSTISSYSEIYEVARKKSQNSLIARIPAPTLNITHSDQEILSRNIAFMMFFYELFDVLDRIYEILDNSLGPLLSHGNGTTLSDVVKKFTITSLRSQLSPNHLVQILALISCKYEPSPEFLFSPITTLTRVDIHFLSCIIAKISPRSSQSVKVILKKYKCIDKSARLLSDDSKSEDNRCTPITLTPTALFSDVLIRDEARIASVHKLRSTSLSSERRNMARMKRRSSSAQLRGSGLSLLNFTPPSLIEDTCSFLAKEDTHYIISSIDNAGYSLSGVGTPQIITLRSVSAKTPSDLRSPCNNIALLDEGDRLSLANDLLAVGHISTSLKACDLRPGVPSRVFVGCILEILRSSILLSTKQDIQRYVDFIANNSGPIPLSTDAPRFNNMVLDSLVRTLNDGLCTCGFESLYNSNIYYSDASVFPTLVRAMAPNGSVLVPASDIQIAIINVQPVHCCSSEFEQKLFAAFQFNKEFQRISRRLSHYNINICITALRTLRTDLAKQFPHEVEHILSADSSILNAKLLLDSLQNSDTLQMLLILILRFCLQATYLLKSHILGFDVNLLTLQQKDQISQLCRRIKSSLVRNTEYDKAVFLQSFMRSYIVRQKSLHGHSTLANYRSAVINLQTKLHGLYITRTAKTIPLLQGKTSNGITRGTDAHTSRRGQIGEGVSWTSSAEFVVEFDDNHVESAIAQVSIYLETRFETMGYISCYRAPKERAARIISRAITANVREKLRNVFNESITQKVSSALLIQKKYRQRVLRSKLQHLLRQAINKIDDAAFFIQTYYRWICVQRVFHQAVSRIRQAVFILQAYTRGMRCRASYPELFQARQRLRQVYSRTLRPEDSFCTCFHNNVMLVKESLTPVYLMKSFERILIGMNISPKLRLQAASDYQLFGAICAALYGYVPLVRSSHGKTQTQFFYGLTLIQLFSAFVSSTESVQLFLKNRTNVVPVGQMTAICQRRIALNGSVIGTLLNIVSFMTAEWHKPTPYQYVANALLYLSESPPGLKLIKEKKWFLGRIHQLLRYSQRHEQENPAYKTAAWKLSKVVSRITAK